MPVDLPPPFDRDVVATVAEESAVATDRLARIVADHHAAVADLPGVENIVYEWRKEYPDPLVERTPGRYVLLVPARLWDEFGTHLDLTDGEQAALAAVHDRQARRFDGVPEAHDESLGYVVLARST